MLNLTLSYFKLGQYRDAVQLLNTLEAQKRVLGDKHPKTFDSMNSLALFYRKLSQDEKAVELQKQIVDARTLVSGDKHPHTLDLAYSYSQLGLGDETVQLFEQTIEARKRVLVYEHPDTLGYKLRLAKIRCSKELRRVKKKAASFTPPIPPLFETFLRHRDERAGLNWNRSAPFNQFSTIFCLSTSSTHPFTGPKHRMA